MTDLFSLDTEVDTTDLRTALGRFATGVVVVTACTPHRPVGMTVNSFCSVSLAPPVVLFCVRHQSQLRMPFATAGAFAVNVLADDQTAVSNVFALPGRDRFAAVRWRPGITRSPVLLDSHSVLECLTDRVLAAGDHDVVLGRVVAVHPCSPGRPLLYYGGGYRALG